MAVPEGDVVVGLMQFGLLAVVLFGSLSFSNCSVRPVADHAPAAVGSGWPSSAPLGPRQVRVDPGGHHAADAITVGFAAAAAMFAVALVCAHRVLAHSCVIDAPATAVQI